MMPRPSCAQNKSNGPARMNPEGGHAMADGRRVPIKTLAKKLHVLDYDLPAPLIERGIFTPPPRVAARKQSASAARPVWPKSGVAGDRVSAQSNHRRTCAPNALGAILHAPISGTVREVKRKTHNLGEIIPCQKNPSVLVELSSVAAGFQVADTMLKAGNVRLILSRLNLLRQIHGPHRR